MKFDAHSPSENQESRIGSKMGIYDKVHLGFESQVLCITRSQENNYLSHE